MSDVPADEQVLKAFESWDKDESGHISREELARVLRLLNPSFRLDDLEKVFDICDVNKDGFLDYEEFIMFLCEGENDAIQNVDVSHVREVVAGEMCSSKCGRPPCKGFRTCCRSCPYVKKREKKFGHDMRCEILHNGGLAFPWYWDNYMSTEEDFHVMDEGAYVQKMGERLLCESIEGAVVEKCLRVENSQLWRKYARRRAEIRNVCSEQFGELPQGGSSPFLSMGKVTCCGKGHELSPNSKAATKEENTPRCFVCRRPGTAYTCEECSYDVCLVCYSGEGIRVGNIVKATEAFETYTAGDKPKYTVEPGWQGTVCGFDWEGDALIHWDEKPNERRYINMSSHGSKMVVEKNLDPPVTRMLLGFSATTTLDDGANEVWLFHGTCEAAAKGITESSFRIPEKPDAAKHGALFGQGAYLAEAAKKSHVYSQNDGFNDCYVMLLCRAALGRSKVVGHTDDRAERFVREDDQFDSLVGLTQLKNSGYAREFLIYDAEQVYPEYIMYYKVESE